MSITSFITVISAVSFSSSLVGSPPTFAIFLIEEDKEVPYYELNFDKTTINDYKRILRKIKISENDIVIPTLIYIKDGNLKSSLVDIKDKNELLSYLENLN